MLPTNVFFVVLIAIFALQPASAFFDFLGLAAKTHSAIDQFLENDPAMQREFCLIGSDKCKNKKKPDDKKDEPAKDDGDEPAQDDGDKDKPKDEPKKPASPFFNFLELAAKAHSAVDKLIENNPVVQRELCFIGSDKCKNKKKPDDGKSEPAKDGEKDKPKAEPKKDEPKKNDKMDAE